MFQFMHFYLHFIWPVHVRTGNISKPRGGGRVVRWCWVNFQCLGVLQFGLQ